MILATISDDFYENFPHSTSCRLINSELCREKDQEVIHRSGASCLKLLKFNKLDSHVYPFDCYVYNRRTVHMLQLKVNISKGFWC